MVAGDRLATIQETARRSGLRTAEQARREYGAAFWLVKVTRTGHSVRSGMSADRPGSGVMGRDPWSCCAESTTSDVVSENVGSFDGFGLRVELLARQSRSGRPRPNLYDPAELAYTIHHGTDRIESEAADIAATRSQSPASHHDRQVPTVGVGNDLLRRNHRWRCCQGRPTRVALIRRSGTDRGTPPTPLRDFVHARPLPNRRVPLARRR